MINPKRLLAMARKWHKVARIRRKRISLPRTNGLVDAKSRSSSSKSVAQKGHFVVYTTDKRRFVVPLMYLNSSIFRELFRMSEEVFGLPRDGPIMLPCDGLFMEYVVSLVQRHVCKDLESASIISVTTGCCSQSSPSILQEQLRQQILIHGF